MRLEFALTIFGIFLFIFQFSPSTCTALSDGECTKTTSIYTILALIALISGIGALTIGLMRQFEKHTPEIFISSEKNIKVRLFGILLLIWAIIGLWAGWGTLREDASYPGLITVTVSFLELLASIPLIWFANLKITTKFIKAIWETFFP